MTDLRHLEQLARSGRSIDVDAEIDALERRLTRRQQARQVTSGVLLLVLAFVGWDATRNWPSPRTVEVTSQPAAAPPSASDCPEGTAPMTSNRVTALAVAAAILTGCTEGPANEDGATSRETPGSEETGAGDIGRWTDVAEMDLTLTGDLTDETELRSTSESLALSDDEEAIRARWASGEMIPPMLRLEDNRLQARLEWRPDAQGAADLSNVSVYLKVDGFLFVPHDDECTIAMEPAAEFVVSGSIHCSGLTGVKGGTDERPTVDLDGELTYHIPVCIAQPFEMQAPCRRIDR